MFPTTVRKGSEGFSERLERLERPQRHPAVSGSAGVLVVLLVALACGLTTGPAGAQESGEQTCRKSPESVANLVPGAERQDAYCLEDLTTKGTQLVGRTNRNDWQGLNASGTTNPPSPVPGLQIDGYFPDDTGNGNNNPNNGYNHNAQFVLRLPEEWNGKVVVTGAPGVRGQYANDFIIGDYVLSKGYAFAATDKGNVGTNFYRDGEEPGDAVAEWHRRVEELTRATKTAVGDYYGRDVEKTYITGISNGGYLTRYALENTPELYDGGVDWEGTLFRAEGPNLLTYLPTALANFPEYRATGSKEAFRNIVEAGFAPESEFLWNDYYTIYWDLTQRIYREEFDPEYDGALGEGGTQPGVPFCQPGTPNCDADYEYSERPESVREAVRKVELTGAIGKPMITLHGDIDTLLPIRTDSDVYRGLIERSGNGDIHRYYTVEEGDHVDSFHDRYPDRVRPILPCHRAAFDALEGWVENGEKPPANGTVERPESGDVVNECSLPAEQEPPEKPEEPGNPAPGACTIRGTNGADRLIGTPGRDVICGGSGNDFIDGRGGDDVLRGGGGNDRLIGGAGRDRLFGERANDALDARDGRPNDLADGGPGRDACRTDRGDTRRSCP
ncbi:Tannase and feruloyl esterase [Rubrobacter radiotolerans]|uniref:Tannase and feruloyl esterase n=1 Tax=Rubrobacter radiotolerans TaxID=42256 RepID=A0A023X0M3_RUBRA|nr:tannase/feruloyl esterase family alpha/beta hydrolase [Rubrobacter radiotolerans]AHY45898.1 Tannase and feruloyl esterase [Rubrobacter radiotolerans]MDX5893312.1 tannase/feruloyl esterase family alpha/beta hydrolase [Rubrobacter radiotolerans]SMC03480.1 Hemolysin-type calcium-binding repeat-containing protein [Rubrobacter radiotolerans DSM 5868]